MQQLRIALIGVCVGIIALATVGGAPQTTMVSVGPNGSQTPQFVGSTEPAISSDGRFVAFVSRANNLVPGTVGNFLKVFVHDNVSGENTLVSVSSTGTQPQGNTQRPAISGDGQIVVFDAATNLVPDDNNGAGDVYAHDRGTGMTTRVSVSSAGSQTFSASSTPAISANGQFVSFQSVASDLVLGDTNGVVDIFVHDLATRETTRVSIGLAEGNNMSSNSALSASGRHVAFESVATNLVAGDTNGASDIFVHDRATGLTERVSVGMGGSNADLGSFNAAISDDGRFVAFESDATNLVPGDTNRLPGFTGRDIFVFDRDTGLTERVSVDFAGAQALSSSNSAAISGDGRYVAFLTISPLVPEDTNGVQDVYVFDKTSPTLRRVSVSSGGGQALGGESTRPVLSGDGRFVAFESRADNLVAADVNLATDIFLHDRGVLNQAPVAQAQDVVIQAGPGCTADISVDAGSFDPDGGAISFVQTPPGPYPLGSTDVIMRVTDNEGAESQAAATVTVIDGTPPTIVAPPPVNATTGGPGSNAARAFIADAALGSAIAEDNCTVNIGRSGVPAGNFFPVGTTTITYTATDSSGNTASATQDVIVSDDTPPVVTVPADLTVNATSAAGAVVAYVVTATDNVSVASFDCSPASGTVFPVGTTTVNCQATDTAGNRTDASFRVSVTTAAEQIVALIERLRGMPLQPVIRAQLLAILQAALANPQNLQGICRGLDVLIAVVRFQAGRTIPVADATQIIADATSIKSALGCP